MPKRKQPERTRKAGRPHMPGYGIEESSKGILPWRWAKNLLSKTPIYFLGTVREDGRPHVMPIWGIWMDDRFYFGSGKKSVKARNIAKNPNCVVCGAEGDAAVIVEGKAAKVRDKAILRKLAAVYLKKYKMDPTTMNEPLFVIRPRVVFGQIEKTFVKTATRWTF
jgi:general stress protein 26